MTIARSTGARVTVLHKNQVGMLEQITNKIADFKLNIEGLANEKRIYIRDLFLFNDYIPDVYAEAFKNIDLSLIEETKMLQSMVFVCNFADFNLDKTFNL